MPKPSFSRDARVRRGPDFQRAYRLRCSASDERIILVGHPNNLGFNRLGLSVSRKIGGAVVRNRWKRLLREAFRLTREYLPSGMDFIVIPREKVEPQLELLQDSLVQLAPLVVRRLSKKGMVP